MSPAALTTSRSSRALETGAAKLWVLLIGVNRYQDDRLPPLAYSALDCQGLAEAIATATQTFPAKSVQVHHDTAALQPAAPPTLAAVRDSLQQIVAAAQPQDTVLFYFSGHGVLDEQQQAVLCLSDTQKDRLAETGLGVQSLLHTLSTCTAHQQLVWLDACHSGGMTLRGKGSRDSVVSLPNPTPQLVALLRQRAAQSKGFYALLSCDQTQQSWEFPELGHGVFTYYLMQGLRGEAADAQGVIEADALYKYVYYQTLRYIDKTNQQLRLINQQQRGRGANQLQPEYPQQTPKRIVEGVGELILGIRQDAAALRSPRQALIADGLGSPQTSLAIGKLLRGAGRFELTYLPQPGKAWTSVQAAIQTCLQSRPASAIAPPARPEATALLYLRGAIEQTETGDSLLVLHDDSKISRSWLRQELRRSTLARQILILDCPGATDLEEWIEDLQIAGDRGQCLIAAAAAPDPDRFAQALLETLTAADPQAGLPIAGWIAQLQSSLAASGVTPHVWLSGAQGVIEVLPGQTAARGSDDAFDLGLCPYMGLRAFGEDDAPFFFGRENLTQQLLAALMRQPFLAIVGASGSGKSSVALAGLVAQLRQGKQIPGSDTWWIRALRPGDRPLTTLAQRLTDGSTEKERALQQMQIEGLLHLGPEGLVQWLRSRPEPMIVLVVDQFEELFTLAPAEDRQRWLDLVLGAVAHAGDRFKLVLTLRTDFIAPCLEIPALAQHLQRSSLLVPPTLAPDDYRQIILRPAEKVGLAVEPELVEVLLQALSHGAGDLPLLEFVLEQVWEHRQPGTLTLQVYQQQVGGLQGALERKAQAVYDSLDPDAQACARWIFLALTQLGDGTEDTRRRVLRSDLAVQKFPAALVDRTLQALTAAKLVVVDREELGGRERGAGKGAEPPEPQPIADSATPTTIEVAHEILIRHWSTLRWWLEENRSRLRAQRQIEQAAQQWAQSGRLGDFLLRGVRLDAAEELYVKYTDELSQEVQQFIEAGLAERDRQQQLSQRRLRRAQIALALIGTLGALAAGFGGVAVWQRQQVQLRAIETLNALSEAHLLADRQIEALTTSMQAGRQLQQTRGAGVALRMQTIATLQQAVATTQERNRLEGHRQQVNAIALHPDGAIASASDDGTIRLWQANGTLMHELAAGDRVTDVAISSDGDWIAASSGSEIQIWNTANQQQERSLTGHTDRVTSVAWSPDSQLIASASRDRTVKLWQADGTPLRSLSGHAGWVNAVGFSPDGDTIATGSEDGTIRLWNVTTGQQITTLNAQTDRVTSIAFSPDGRTLAAARGDGTVQLWNLAAQTAQLLAGHTDQATSVQFSPDGQTIASASLDGTIALWSAAGEPLVTLRGHGGAVLDASFSRDGGAIVSASADKRVRVWQVASPVQQSPDAAVAGFSPQGQAIAVGTADQIEIQRPDAPPIRLIGAAIVALSFSPSEQRLAAGSDTGAVQLWDTSTGAKLQTLSGHQGRINSLAFSPDDRLLASASEDKTIRLWSTADGSAIASLSGHADSVSSVAFSPSGDRLASGSYDSTVKLWRADGTLLRTLTGHGLAIAAIAFSPDGQAIASGSWDNTIRLWRVSDGALLQTLSGHQDGVTSLSFSPDGKILASGSADQTIQLWDWAAGEPIKTLRGAPAPVQQLRFEPEALVGFTEAGLQTWALSLNDLLDQSCDRLHDYLQALPPAPPLCPR